MKSSNVKKGLVRGTININVNINQTKTELEHLRHLEEKSVNLNLLNNYTAFQICAIKTKHTYPF